MSTVILVVDDEKEIRDMLSRHFRFKGYETLLADCVDAAIKILQTTRVDIVVSDILMPGRSGIELIEEIHAQAPMVRTIMMTGFVTLENALACMRKGAETCVFKPLTDLRELDEAVLRSIHWLENWNLKLKALHDMRPSGG